MTIGVIETVLLAAIWAATVITLTAIYLRDLIRRRRHRWRRYIQTFDPRRP